MPRDERRLIVVANRLPVTRVGSGDAARWQSSAGGLVTAVAPILQKTGGSWVGWTGGSGGSSRGFDHDGIRMKPVPLTDTEVDRFYHGFSNRTLWPLFHDAIRTPEFHRDWWRPYIKVNIKFARAAAALCRAGDLVWVHDYHLLLAPAMIRKLRPDVRIGFYLHIPFPPEELFAWLPWRRPLLEGLLGADVVGFQTQAAAQNFSRAARHYAEVIGTDTRLYVGERPVLVGTYPISIDFDWFESVAAREDTMEKAAEIRKRIGTGRKILLAVDRLDYTKGIDTRLHAYEDMLRRRAVTADECVFMQVAVPSREQVSDYAALRAEVERAVGRINGDFSSPGRVAVHYFRRSLTREDVTAYYRAADVMVVTPLRDGMNLVAKEYIATRHDNSGVLVLSEFAGAARELRRALLVNPRDIDGMAATMTQALKLPKSDARQRMAILRTVVRRHDVYEWADLFLEALRG